MAFSFRAGTNWCHDFPKLARESGFHFNMHRRRVRVDWNRISSIDIDRVIGERDFSTIDDNVNNVVDYCLESEYDVKILDSNFVKLFRLAQLAVEYLLYCKQYLDHSVVILKDELRAKLQENVSLKNEQSVNEKTIRELRERSRIIETKLNDSHGEIHRCPQCPKTFVSALFMSAHVNRRHPNISRTCSISPLHEQYKAETEKLHSEIKSLKERLNLTERVIRNESEKFLSSESVVSNDNNRESRIRDKGEIRNQRDRDELIEEQHRRYQEGIENLKTTLFDEIRNHKFSERFPREKLDNDDYNNISIKELIREQESEIKRLRQQLSTKSTSDVEAAEAKRDNQEIVWQSKIDYIESRHRADIEKLYAQLRITQETADKMRFDYTTRMNDLERREANFESTLVKARDEYYENMSLTKKSEISNRKTSEFHVKPRNPTNKLLSRKKHFSQSDQECSNEINVNDVMNEENSSDSSDASIEKPENRKFINNKKMIKEETKKIVSAPKVTKIMLRDGNQDDITPARSCRGPRERKIKLKVDETDVRENFKNGVVKNRLTSNFAPPKGKIGNLVSRERSLEKNNEKFVESNYERSSEEISKKRESLRDVENTKVQFPRQDKRDNFFVTDKGDVSKTGKNGENLSASESEEEDSESSLESESSDNSSEVEEIEVMVDDRTKNREIDYGKRKFSNRRKESCPDGLELFHAKLRDLGIDPEWRGIPDATFSQVLEIVRHHHNINSKKYRKFEDIRRMLIQQLTRRLSIREKDLRNDDSNEQSHLGRLVTNVKSKVSKALNILEKNDGSHNARSISTKNKFPPSDTAIRKFSPDRATMENEICVRKSNRRDSIALADEDTHLSRSEQNVKVEKNITSNDKRLSQSYESIKDFIKDTNNRQKKSIFNVSGTLVSSTPHKKEEIPIGDSSLMANESANNSALRLVEHRESLSALSINSPRMNSKSVLKTTNPGSSSSLVKKKVLFDLESEEKITDGTGTQSMYPMDERENNEPEKSDTSESDFEISSIYEEKDQTNRQKDDSPQNEKIVLLKTSQSEKIAQISKQIEEQLSIARRKPAGAVEAMFLEKFTLGSDNKEIPINVYPSSTMNATRLSRDNSTEAKLPKTTVPTWQSRNKRFANTRNRDSDIHDTNLDMDIDELLRIE